MKRPDEQLSALQALDRAAPEQVANLRAVTAGWSHEDARWDALVDALDFACRDHAHSLAEKIREKYRRDLWATKPPTHWAADLIDPEAGS